MDNHFHIRRQHWVSKLADKMGRERMAAALGYSDANYLNQVVTGHSKLGNQNARKWAEKLGLPADHFDQPVPSDPLETHSAEAGDGYGSEDEFMAMAESLDKRMLIEYLAAAAAILNGPDQVELAETILRNARESLS